MGAPFRFLRAGAVTAATFSLAAGAHVLGGGVLPALPATVMILALTLAPVMALTGRKLSAPLMVGLVSISQLVLHAAFTAFSEAGHLWTVHAGHVHGAGAPVLVEPVLVEPVWAESVWAESVLVQSHAAAGAGLLMVVAHAAAALATALLLARGEAGLWAVASWLRPLVRVPKVAAVWPMPRIPVPPIVRVPSRWRNLRLPALRGPPAPAAS